VHRRSESEARILSAHGIAHDVLATFDHLYYFYANPLVAADLNRPNRRRCLIHFCERGVNHLLAFNDRTLFDPAFYIENYLGGAPVPPSAAYRHWLNVGRRVGRAPDRNSYIRSILDVDETTIAKIDFDRYLAFSKLSEPPIKFTDAFYQFVEHEVLHLHDYLPVTEASADFFTSIAERFSSKGQNREALTIFERILVSIPKHRRALINRADALARTGNILDVLRTHETVIRENEALLWSHLHRAHCYIQLGNYRKALLSLRSGILSHPGDALLRRRFQEVADEFLPREWQQAVARGLARNPDDAQTGLYEACRTISSLNVSSTPLPHRPVRSVAIVGTLSQPQCRLYRIDQKIEHLETAGFRVTLYDWGKDISHFLSQIFSFDAVIFYRLPAWAPVIFAIQKAKELGVVTLYDIDDFIFGEKDYPDSLESFGGLITSKEWVELKMGGPFYRHAISLCDFAIASTRPLADEMAKLVGTGRAFVHRNAFGRVHELQASIRPEARRGDKITIFYGSGTKSHKGDFQELVEPGLVEMVRRYGDKISIVLVGYNVMSERLNSIGANLKLIEPNWDIATYWSLLRSADINIAVLKQTPMADCKSEIKWMEAAMFAVPSIVSGTATYREVIEPGITGLICDTADEWTAALDFLVANSSSRRSIGLEAQRRVRDRYNIPVMAENLSKIFESITVFSPTVTAPPTVLIVNVFYPPQALGGATRVVHDNVKHLSSVYGEDVHIEVFTTAVGGERDYEISCYVQDGVRVTAVSRPTLDAIETRITDDGMERIFGNFIDSVRPSVVHFHCIQRLSTSIVTAVRKRKIPYLITVHDGWWISDFQFIVDDNGEPALYDYLNLALLENERARITQLRPLLFGASKVLAVSEKFADLYRDCGVPNVLAVANGVSNFPEVRRTGSVDGRVRLGFIGGASRHKGYHLIKYALLGRNFEHLRLTVVDAALVSGDSRSEVWNTTPVDFLPKYPESQVGELYATIDVLLAPSVCVESFGLITREALQCGCWVIASDRGSIGECVTGGYNGYVIDVSDADDLIRALSEIEKNPQRYLSPPPEAVPFRTAAEQADELAKLYMSLFPAATTPTANGETALPIAAAAPASSARHSRLPQHMR
jgi:glycosyltransferase involved in cell wall biosynthesis